MGGVLLGLVTVGQCLPGDLALVEREVDVPVRWCPRCGCRAKSLELVVRRLTHVPFGTRPTIVVVHAGHCVCRTYQTFRRDDFMRPVAPQQDGRWASSPIRYPSHLQAALRAPLDTNGHFSG